VKINIDDLTATVKIDMDGAELLTKAINYLLEQEN
jgi:hypothetical protein